MSPLPPSIGAASPLPRFNVSVLDPDGQLSQADTLGPSATYISAALYQDNGTQLLSNLEGTVTVRASAGNASFTDLAVVGIAGRDFRLRFSVKSWDVIVVTYSSAFDVTPARLFVPHDFSGRETATVGEKLTAPLFLLDGRGAVVDMWSSADFEFRVRMTKDGQDVSQHLTVHALSTYNVTMPLASRACGGAVAMPAADAFHGGPAMAEAQHGCSALLVLSLHAVAADVRLCFDSPHDDIANVTTAAFAVFPPSLLITEHSLTPADRVLVPLAVGMPMGRIVLSFALNRSQFNASASWGSSMLDSAAIVARLSCADGMSSPGQAKTYLGDTYLGELVHDYRV